MGTEPTNSSGGWSLPSEREYWIAFLGPGFSQSKPSRWWHLGSKAVDSSSLHLYLCLWKQLFLKELNLHPKVIWEIANSFENVLSFKIVSFKKS